MCRVRAALPRGCAHEGFFYWTEVGKDLGGLSDMPCLFDDAPFMLARLQGVVEEGSRLGEDDGFRLGVTGLVPPASDFHRGVSPEELCRK